MARTILSHLEAARAVIVVWSKRSIGPHGQFVRDEATRALKRGTLSSRPHRQGRSAARLRRNAGARPGQGGKGTGRTSAIRRCSGRFTSGLESRPLIGTLAERQTGMSRRTAIDRHGRRCFGGRRRRLVFWRPGEAHANSIAVLPFANLSGDPAQAYFSDGIAEELRSALSRIAGLKVVARTSSEIMRNEDAKTASQKLGVPNILTGSVRRSASMIRVSAQLVDGHQGTERWAEMYDRPPATPWKSRRTSRTGSRRPSAFGLGERIASASRKVAQTIPKRTICC